MNPHVICIQDLSCFGKCSLTISLPVLSSAGISVTPLPTALLSTHTGGLGKPYRLDLAPAMREIRHHWQTLSFPVAALYSSYVSHSTQVAEIAALFSQYPQALHLVDPVLGDQGKLYASLDDPLITAMRQLCCQADIITPNMTEAYALLQEPYQDGPYSEQELLRLSTKLHQLTQAAVVVTGGWLKADTIGCAVYEKGKQPQLVIQPRLNDHFHGSGDLFAAALLGAYLNGRSLVKSCEIAMHYTVASMEYTRSQKQDERYGLLFEPFLAQYAESCKND